MINLDDYDVIGHDVICDETNNSDKDREEKRVNVDIYLKVKPKEVLKSVPFDITINSNEADEV